MTFQFYSVSCDSTVASFPGSHDPERVPGSLGTAIFEFGRGFYGNTYTPVLSDLTLTPGRLQIASDRRRKAGRGLGTCWNEADLHVQQL